MYKIILQLQYSVTILLLISMNLNRFNHELCAIILLSRVLHALTTQRNA